MLSKVIFAGLSLARREAAALRCVDTYLQKA